MSGKREREVTVVAGISERRTMLTAWLLALAALSAGCNGVWDDVTSREFWSAEGWKADPEPLVVLRDSRDGDKRHRALLRLGEIDPKTLPQDEADAILQVLVNAVGSERQVWARLAAVKALANWNDRRAVEGLKDAYYRAGAFPGEGGAALRVQALTALGQCGHPDAAEILLKVLSEPPVEGAESERQEKLEERLAAARALGQYSSTKVTGALVGVLRKEKDPGLRRRSHESLVRITGRQLPPEAEVWENFLRDPNSVPGPSIGERFSELLPVRWSSE